MIDMNMLRREANGPGHEVVPITRRLLNELVKLAERPPAAIVPPLDVSASR